LALLASHSFSGERKQRFGFKATKHAGAQVQSVQAYVISGVQERWLSTSKVLATLGIQPQRVVPVKPTQKLAEREFTVRRPPCSV